MKHVIIGAGAAGMSAAEHLRKLDPVASITVLDGEGEGPYARMAIPYLLSNQIGEDGTRLRSGASSTSSAQESAGHPDKERP